MGTWIIARLTFREASRRKIALTGFLLGLAFVLLFSVGFFYVNQQRLTNASFPGVIAMDEFFNTLTLAGLYVVNFLIVVMAALVTADTLAGEISTGTIQSLVTKPMRRSEIVLGKWLGYAILLALYVVLMAGGILVSVVLQSGYSMPNVLTERAGPDVPGCPGGHDHYHRLQQPLFHHGHRRPGDWAVRAGLCGQLGGADWFSGQQPGRRAGRDCFQPAHAQ